MRRITNPAVASIVTLAILLMATAVPTYGQGSESVKIQGFQFQPHSVTIVQGGTVTWTNEDSAVHDVSFTDGSTRDLKKGESYSKTFSKPGTYDYRCNIHPAMKGTVVVK